MNAKRGLFRLWIIFLIIFATVTILSSIDIIKNEFKNAAWVQTHQLMLPVDCAKARGKLSLDYINNLEGNFCWYTNSKFRLFYPEYKDLNDEQLSIKLYEKANIKITPSRPWIVLLKVISLALGIPIAIFVLGWSLIWALSGFISKSSNILNTK